MKWSPLLVLACAAALSGQVSADALASLIRALASSDYAVREAAHRDLLALGPAAKDALIAARSSQTLEARLRIDALLAAQHSVTGTATAPLAGVRVTEDFRGKTLAAAVARLEQLCAAKIILGEPPVLGGAPDVEREAQPDNTPPVTSPDQSWQQRVLSLAWANTPLLQVLDELCLEAGLLARRGNNGEIILNPGQGVRGLAAYDGPLKLGITNVSITRSVSPGAAAYASMHVQLQLEVEPGATPLGVLLPLGSCSATDDQQRTIKVVAQGGMRPQVSQMGPQRQQWMNATFEPPERDAKLIAELLVPLRLLVPEEMQHFELAPAAANPARAPSAEDHETARAWFDAQGRLEISLPAAESSAPPEAGTVRRSDQVTLLDGAGKPLNARLVRASESASGLQQTYEGAAGATLVRVSVVRKWRVEARTLRFTDIKLP